MRSAVIFIGLLGMIGNTQELKPDRPGLTDPADTVGSGTLQFESGFTASKQLAGPAPNLRYGISRRVELRFSGEGYVRQARRWGLSDHSAALKFKLWDEHRWLPAVTAIPAVSLPLGGATFSSGGYDPALRIAVAKGLPAGISLGGNAGMARITDACEHVRQTTFTLAAARALNRRYSAFVEGYQASFSGSRSVVRIADAGLMRAVGRHMQLDCSFGRAATQEGPSWFVSAGMVVRVYPRGER